MQFLVIHGSFGSPEGNWFSELREKLEALDQTVIAPQFPVDDWEQVTQAGKSIPTSHQNLTNWLTKFESILPQINSQEKLCVVGHSLGPLFALHLVKKFNLTLDCAIFVSPFLEKLNKAWQIDQANATFYKTDFDFEKLKQLIPLSYVLYSDNDPYVDVKYPIDFAHKLGSSMIPVKHAGHMNSEVNLNEFPLVLELCKSRLDLTLYQRYLAHRSELYAVDYLKGKTEEVVFLDPTEVQDEGIFHFRNLSKGGFCTCITGTKFWDPHSKYMLESRQAAQRTHDFTRVMVAGDLEDLESQAFKDQIKLDLEGGVKVYLVKLSDIKDLIPDPDFGTWDNEYRCIVRFDYQKQAQEVELSSRLEDIQTAMTWKKLILAKSTPISNLETDIIKFKKVHNP